MNKLSLLLIGNAALTQQCGAVALARGHWIAAVVTADPQVRAWALGLGIRVEAQEGDWIAALAGVQADWLLSIANLELIPPAGLALARKGGVNFHDGPLPRRAGLNAPVWAILEGDSRHGISWHLIAPGVDTGDILERRDFDLAADETALTLNTRCFEAGIESFPALLTQLETAALRRQPQEGTGRRQHRRADRPAAMGRIDFTRPRDAVLRLMRGLDHGAYWNPVAMAKIAVDDRILNAAHAAPAAGQGEPGQVLRAGPEALVVACADGAIAFSGLTCAGGHPVDPASITASRLPLLQPATAARLDALAGKVAGREPALRRALLAMQPVALPELRAGGDALWQKIALPAGLGLPALALAALRASGAEAGDFAVPAVSEPGLVSAWNPLHLAAPGAVGPALAAAAQALGEARDQPGFALDLLTRDPQLAGCHPPEIGLSDQGPVPGSIVTLTATAMHFDAACFPPPLAEAYVLRLAEIAAAVQAGGAAAFASLPRLSRAEHDQVIHGVNASRASIDTTTCLHDLIAAQARRTPEAIAASCAGESLSYAALDGAANRMAQVLVGMGAAPGVLIGLCLPRGLPMLVAALAILKSGAAYVPMDPTYPKDRIAHFIADSACPVIVTDSAMAAMLPASAELLLVDRDARLAAAPAIAPETAVTAADLAYVIYTSGSTGKPKGVMVEHRNVVNFFAGMDQALGTAPGVWLAVTSMSFDISVLELFWTLARGCKLVLTSEANRALVSSGHRPGGRGMEFSLYFWGNDDAAGADKYRLLLDAARYGDEAGFSAIWTPERHFHAFGGPYPNPSVTGAAVAAVTRNIGVRAGSCVSPLHHPLRIAEEWAVVDNLCNGRAGLAIASGWHPDDFILWPQNSPPNNRAIMFQQADQLRRLWRGEAVEFPRGDGSMKAAVSQPRPLSRELPLWITTAGNPDTWIEAGKIGAHVLTHLLGQSIDEVAGKIVLYRQALREAGHDPAAFRVSLMLHTYLAETREAAREVARGPMKSYLATAASLIRSCVWAFPAFKKPKGVDKPDDIDIGSLSADEVDAILEFAFDRYFEDSGMFGTVADGVARVEQLKAIGVDEVACLVDYGIAADQVLAGLRPLAEVQRRANAEVPQDHSIAAELVRHAVTHLQCTPSMARMLLENDESRLALRGLQTLLLGGEALPEALAVDLARATDARLFNMYGPTETTVWSACDRSAARPVLLGKPLANQQIYVLDGAMQPVPPGVAGEIWIGGTGVSRGYWRQEALTAERFVADPFAAPDAACPWGARLYRSGDLGTWQGDGRLAFHGRADTQIKLRGYRIELGEIDSLLARLPGVRAAVTHLREDQPGDARIVAYVVGSEDEAALRAAIAAELPEHMRPAHYVFLDALPLTPNQKLNRKALPRPQPRAQTAAVVLPPRSDTEAAIAEVWRKVLGVESVGAKDNFFAIGGHSLLAVQAHRALRDALAMPSLSITDIFRFPVLEALAAHIAPPPAPSAESAEDASARAEVMARRRAMRTGGGAGHA